MIVHDAARATLAAGTARVRQVRFVEGGEAASWREEGETDFARLRTRTLCDQAVPDGWREVFQRIEQRWPWLGDDEPAAGQRENIYAGMATWFVADGSAVALTRGSAADRRRLHVDPAWIVDVVHHAQREEPHADGSYGFICDLVETGDAIVAPPHPWRRAPRIVGEVQLDAAGRIGRATWRCVDRTRPRGLAPPVVTWTTTELWDFGVPVTIAVPEPERDPPLPLMAADLGWRLWRRKRAYERRVAES